MGKRAQLFYAARECIDTLKCPKANEILYEHDFGLCMIFLTRQKLMNVAHKIITNIYKRNYQLNVSNLRRYYKLNKLHTFQLTKYNEIFSIDMHTNKMYLQKISYMITSLSKNL